MKKKKGLDNKKFGDWFFAAVFFFVLLLILAALDQISYQESVLDKEKSKLLNAITSDSVTASKTAFVVHDQVDKGRLIELAKKGYTELKSEIGIKNDFAILFTNGEETVVPIGNAFCIGSPDTKVAGRSCG